MSYRRHSNVARDDLPTILGLACGRAELALGRPKSYGQTTAAFNHHAMPSIAPPPSYAVFPMVAGLISDHEKATRLKQQMLLKRSANFSEVHYVRREQAYHRHGSAVRLVVPVQSNPWPGRYSFTSI